MGSEPVSLDLAWEAVQSIYTTYSNTLAYHGGLQKFCSFAEQTALIKITKRHVQGYYDAEEMETSASAGLQDFLDPRWRKVFTDQARDALRRARVFVKAHHERADQLSKQELFRCIREATAIHQDLFVAFTACQPQYTSRVFTHLRTLLPASLSETQKRDVLQTLMRSMHPTPMRQEEIVWDRLRKARHSAQALARHVRLYGLLGAADGLPPWTVADLQRRGPIASGTAWERQQRAIRKAQADVIKRYHLSRNVVALSRAVGELGHLRLCLRVQGWMPLEHLLIQEFFPRLAKVVPYTVRQLECCRPAELFQIMKGKRSVSARMLDQRWSWVVYGMLRGKEVWWTGETEKRKWKKLFTAPPVFSKFLSGQSATSGRVKGRCYVLRWGAANFLSRMQAMPRGAILVVGQTRPQLMTALNKARAIVTDEGGLLSHAAIVSRELNIPCVIGIKIATKILHDGDLVEVNATRGEVRILGSTHN